MCSTQSRFVMDDGNTTGIRARQGPRRVGSTMGNPGSSFPEEMRCGRVPRQAIRFGLDWPHHEENRSALVRTNSPPFGHAFSVYIPYKWKKPLREAAKSLNSLATPAGLEPALPA